MGAVKGKSKITLNAYSPRMQVVKRKIVLLGDGAVGKTSLINRFVLNKFSDKYIQTIGVKVSKKTVTVDDTEMILMIWDVLGQKGFTKVQEASLRGSEGAFLVCDLTRPETLSSLTGYWRDVLVRAAGEVPVILLANKSDLEWAVSEDDVRAVADELSAPWYITSAKTGENVEEAFHNLAGMMLEFEPVRRERGEEKADVMNLRDVLDYIMTDFARTYGSFEDAMPIIRKQFERANIKDMENPTYDEIERLIKNLYELSREMMGDEKAYRMRLRWVGKLRKFRGGDI